ncbi:hypothetical protein NQ317_018477 [Molorchus minor]|uniref:Uncharacterized protein n=1 Tax=Molorchus minor TaxID=1323400 RepID=A0ABQ9J4W1_9CUCU|nr:hypothetical protein NQ317_018477 [Molorchus minor]
MHTTTLRGCFPRTKRNFIKENVRSIKQMQGLLQDVGATHPRPARDDKYRNAPGEPKSRESTPHTHSTLSQDTKSKVVKSLKKTTIKSNIERKKEKPENIGEQGHKFTPFYANRKMG